jgi:hypothetical protein
VSLDLPVIELANLTELPDGGHVESEAVGAGDLEPVARRGHCGRSPRPDLRRRPRAALRAPEAVMAVLEDWLAGT